MGDPQFPIFNHHLNGSCWVLLRDAQTSSDYTKLSTSLAGSRCCSKSALHVRMKTLDNDDELLYSTSCTNRAQWREASRKFANVLTFHRRIDDLNLVIFGSFGSRLLLETRQTYARRAKSSWQERERKQE